MKFKILITGEFNNIKGLAISQDYFITIKCGSCGTQHKKTVFISSQDKKLVEVKQSKWKTEAFNLSVECNECKEMMNIKIAEPEEKIEVSEELYVFPVKGNSCHVSTIQSDNSVVQDVDGLILDAVSEQNVVFENCSFNKRILAEDDYKGMTIYIQNFNIEVQQV